MPRRILARLQLGGEIFLLTFPLIEPQGRFSTHTRGAGQGLSKISAPAVSSARENADSTLVYSDEVRTLDEFRTDTEWLAPQELELAHLLVESLAARFEPAKYKDSYCENLRALINAKVQGEELKLGAMESAPAPVPDILEALKASLERLKKPVVVAQQPPQPAQAPKRTRKALAS
jgi:hypothetical protein